MSQTATSELFSSGARVEEIAQTANVGRQTVYRHLKHLPTDVLTKWKSCRAARRCRPCRICAIPEIAEKVKQALVAGLGFQTTAKLADCSWGTVRNHALSCLPRQLYATILEASRQFQARHMRDVTTRRWEAGFVRKPRTKGYRKKKQPETDSLSLYPSPKREAEFLFLTIGVNGETVESVRKSVSVTERDQENLRSLELNESRLVRYRARVLAELDSLIANPPERLLRQAERRRAQIIRTQERERAAMVIYRKKLWQKELAERAAMGA